jgi:hypothetical protein
VRPTQSHGPPVTVIPENAPWRSSNLTDPAWPIVSIKSDTSDNTLTSRIAPDNVRLMCLHASIVGAPRPSLYRHTPTDGSGECRDVQPQPSSFRSGSCDRRVLQPVAVGPYDLVVLIGGKPVESQFKAPRTSNRACPRNVAHQSRRFRVDLAVGQRPANALSGPDARPTGGPSDPADAKRKTPLSLGTGRRGLAWGRVG